VATALAVVLALVGCGREDPYAAFRQARAEPIPGTFGWTLEPPGDADAALSPQQAYRGIPGADREPEVFAILAIVGGEDGSRTAPAWVFVTRHLCYFTAKGDLVSPGRSGDRDPCTDDNLLVQAVDARTGELVRVISAFDFTHRWAPDREGDPALAQVAGATRFH
jgi:hypothetical protein